MLDSESAAADAAIANGLYVTYGSEERSRRDGKGPSECTRVAPTSRCFCSHALSEHFFTSKKDPSPRCSLCECSHFEYVPSRPEECGLCWLVRRKGFNINTWRATCRCKHSHEQHHPLHKRCRSCGCSCFQSDFACLVCDRSWEDHKTLFETTIERAQQGKTHGDRFRPLASDLEIQRLALGTSAGASNSHLRPLQVAPDRGERSVRLMGKQSGGALR